MKKAKGFFAEFKKFITRGNVLDMAVGVIVGGAFTAIVNGLSNFILRPVINWLIALIMGGEDLSKVYTVLHPVYVDGVLDMTQSIYIDWGSFISAVINFFLIALVLFIIVRTINKLSEGYKAEAAHAEEVKKYMKEGMTRKQAEAAIEEAKKAAEEAKAEEERLAKEAEEAAKAAEAEKAMANTRLLEEIRDLLKNK